MCIHFTLVTKTTTYFTYITQFTYNVLYLHWYFDINLLYLCYLAFISYQYIVVLVHPLTLLRLLILFCNWLGYMFIPLISGYFSVYLDYSPYLVYFPTSLLLLVILALILGSAQFTLWFMCNYSSSVHLTYFRMCLYRPIYYSIEKFYVYTHIMSIFDVCLCVGMFIQEFWPLLRLLILLNLIWWQVSNLSKISRIVLPWIQRSIDSHFGWNYWSIICLTKVSSWVSNVSKEWIWHAKSWISGPGVWSISPIMRG